MKVTCQRCKYEWNYTGHKKSTERIPAYITCSQCRANVKIPVNVEEK